MDTRPADTGLGPVAELRQYTLHPGRRDDLVEVFEQHFITGQEACGITVGGLFEDEADPDRFLWMRGFPDLERRTQSLEAFYGGPVWADHRDRANDTMVDSDDVLLLQPHERAGSVLRAGTRAVIGTWLGTESETAEGVAGYLSGALGVPVVTWRPHPGPNGFPALPVRDENATVWLATFRDEQERQDALERLHACPSWTELNQRLGATAYTELLLTPTPRSRHTRS